MKVKISYIKEKYHKQISLVCWLSVTVGFVMTRFWQLDALPRGLHIDEAGMAYDAWCLSEYGVDRWMKSWPVYLSNFGSGQSSLYAFLCAFLFRVFGYSIWMIRLPSVVFSFFTLLFGVKLAKKIYPQKDYLVWITALMVTFCPYFVMASRIGLDCNLMLGASTVFLYYYVTALESGEFWRYIVSGMLGGILLYTYVLSYLILPAFLLLSFSYAVRTEHFHAKWWICMMIIMAIFAFPLLMVQIVNYFQFEEIQLGIFTITKMSRYRISEFSSFRFENLLIALKSIFVGDNHLFDSIPGINNLYIGTIPFFVLGAATLFRKAFIRIRKKCFEIIDMVLLWFITILIVESHMESNTYRINGIFLVTVLIAVEGIRIFCCLLDKWMPQIFGVIVMGYAMAILHFGAFYFLRYNDATYLVDYFGVPVAEGAEFLEADEELCNRITFVSERGIFYAVERHVPPDEFDISGDESGVWKNFWFGSLQEISEEYNYIVRDGMEEYCNELRNAGFSEKQYDNYSVFYKK